ncbi:membrane hypothetical protein [Tenacibaculum xiamenense]
MIVRKKVIRYLPILTNLLRSILTPSLSLMLSFVIVNYFSKSLWGNFIEIQLYFFVALILSDWGTKTYLQKAFSITPKNMIKIWQEQLLARTPLVILSLLTLVILVNYENTILLIFWYIAAFIYNSFLSILFYNRNYLFLISIELFSFLLLNLLLLTGNKNLTLDHFILFYTIHILLKALCVSIKYKTFLKFTTFEFHLSNLKFGLPFFLISITGFLHSKIDIYVFAFFYDKIALGEYQIVSSFFIFSQSVITILLLPYIKNIYRLNTEAIKKIRFNISFLGLLVNTFVIYAIALILKTYFNIYLTSFELFLGFFIGYPSYLYSIKVFELFKHNKEKKVVIVSIIGLSLNLILSLTFSFYNFKILGCLLANAITQIVTMIIYFLPLTYEEYSKEYK